MEEPITREDVDRFIPEIQARARALLRKEWNAASLATDDLVASAYKRLVPSEGAGSDVTWQNRDHLLATYYLAMEQVLTDHARKRGALKRDRQKTVRLDEVPVHALPRVVAESQELVLALKEALAQLEQTRPAWAAIIKSRLLGLTFPEIVQARGVSEKTVKRAADQAEHWLRKRLNEAEGPGNADDQAS